MAAVPLWLVCVAGSAQAQVAAGETLVLEARLRSPWGEPLTTTPAGGATLRLSARDLTGPAPLRCPHARHRFYVSAPEDLFEGNLPAPAGRSAAALGMPTGLVTQRVSCANASFDLHRAADGRAWLGLDNAVLRFTPQAVADSPEAAVQTLLLRHLAGEATLSAKAIAEVESSLTPALAERFRRWFAKPVRPDEVPDLNGDPFTDSQERPGEFSIEPARRVGTGAEVAVRFGGDRMTPWRVRMVLARVDGRWRVDDVRSRSGPRLTQLIGR